MMTLREILALPLEERRARGFAYGYDYAGGDVWYPGSQHVAGWPKRDQRTPYSWSCWVCRQRLHAATEDDVRAQADGHQCPACPECEVVFTAETWPTRHTRCDGEDIHATCCRWCGPELMRVSASTNEED